MESAQYTKPAVRFIDERHYLGSMVLESYTTTPITSSILLVVMTDDKEKQSRCSCT